jgi:hypothetical protein
MEEESEYQRLVRENRELKSKLKEGDLALQTAQFEITRFKETVHSITKQAILRGMDVPRVVQAVMDTANTAQTERNAAMAEAERERDIRRRVHARFKRIRREVALGAYNLKQERARVESLERQLAAKNRQIEAHDSEALKFAALAYRILDSEDKENLGQEPSFP